MDFFALWKQKDSFEDILTLAKEKDKKWLWWIFDLYHERIYNFVYKRVSNIEDTENICSIIWERICKYIHNFEWLNKSQFEWWIIMISKNQIITYVKKNKFLLEDIEDHSYIKDEAPTPLETAIISSWNEFMLDLVNKLPNKQSKCVKLKYFDWYKNKEISKILEINEASVASNLKRWLERLKQLLW